MNVKKLLENETLKRAALLLAEKRFQLMENPGDGMLFEQTIGMVHMAYGVVDDGYALKTLYDYYVRQLGRPLPKPGDAVLYYDPMGGQPKPAKVVESLDSTTLDQPKLVRCECGGQVLELQDRHIYLRLYWNERS